MRHRKQSLSGSKLRVPAWRLMVLPIIAACAGCASAPAGTTPLWLGQIGTPDMPVQQVQLRSWKTRKFDGLVRQQTDFSCGAAVLATIFNHAYGRTTTERQVLVNMLKVADPDIVRDKGFSLLDMKKYVASIGMRGEGYKVEFDQLSQLEIPAIVLIDIKGYKHFVIVRRIFPDRVAIGDPALGNRTMTPKSFVDAWNGVAFVVLGDGYDTANALLDPPEPLSARRLLETHARLPAAETAEFGVGPGYQFSF